MNEPIIRNYEELTLDSDTFQQIRENFDLLFQKLLRKMEQNNSEEGSITLKIDVNLETDWVPDDDGNSKEIHKPLIKHKVTTTVPVKDSFDGKKETGMNLVYDEDLKRYVLRYVQVGGQRSIFDDDFQENMQDSEIVSEGKVVEPAALPGPGMYLNPPEDMEDDVQDAQESDSDVLDIPDEENTDSDGMWSPQGDTESTEADDYEYDDPEEE